MVEKKVLSLTDKQCAQLKDMFSLSHIDEVEPLVFPNLYDDDNDEGNHFLDILVSITSVIKPLPIPTIIINHNGLEFKSI